MKRKQTSLGQLLRAKLGAKIIKKNCVMDGWMELIWLFGQRPRRGRCPVQHRGQGRTEATTTSKNLRGPGLRGARRAPLTTVKKDKKKKRKEKK